jgi:subfamily B ATP-binding cassette protein MsbA
VAGYGGWLVTRGRLTPGDLLVFTSYLGMLWHPLCALTGFYASMQGGAASAQRVFEVLDRDPVIADAPDAIALPRQPRTIELDGVGFSYGSGNDVLRDVSMTIEPGQLVAFVGTSGGGKSTLLNLIPRFFDPTSGAVRFDGIDARRIRLADVRKHVAMVMQEAIILPTTIAENIAYGRPDATAGQIRAAAELAGAAEFIEKLHAGYQTRLVEKGYNLSGGQRQRVGIARALLTEAPFVVLDEPTSALDPQNEHLVTQTLRSLKGQRTVILVSHRLSSVVDCDQIFVLDRGRVAEQGTHAGLLARRGIYYGMARQQGLVPAGATAPARGTDVVPRAA